ncbi:MAG: hypothetical protein U1E36_05845 [Rickettsiales bacterium]
MTFTKSVPAFLAVAMLAMGAVAAEPAKTVHTTTPAKTASATAKSHVVASNTAAAKKALQDKCMKQYPNDHAQYLKCAEGTGTTKTN